MSIKKANIRPCTCPKAFDDGQLGRNYEALRLVGDARETIAALHRELLNGDLTERSQRRSAVEQRIAQGRAAYEQESQPVNRYPSANAWATKQLVPP